MTEGKRDPMPHEQIARVLDLVPPESQSILNLSLEEAGARLLSDTPETVLEIEGSFALVAQDGERVRMARSLDRPLRYFLAKQADGPMLVVADRIDAIREALEREG
jgi:asparagine synthase (glutamine-hydrolysing)